MKTKLLKKVRKRFGYYKRKELEGYVLIDHKLKEVSIVDTENYPPGKLEVSKDLYLFRKLKELMLSPFIDYSEVYYKTAVRKLRK